MDFLYRTSVFIICFYYTELQRSNLEDELIALKSLKETTEGELKEIKSAHEKIKTIFEKRNYARTQREKTATTFETINNTSNSTRYKRREETRNQLEYIHGGKEGAIYGAWDFLCASASNDLIERLIVSFRRGNFIQKLYGKFTKTFQNSEAALKQALAKKYASYLSRRKYNFICKIERSTFDPDSQTWEANKIDYGEYKIEMKTAQISHLSVQKFAKSLDIGDIQLIPGLCGAARTVTALVTMMIDLTLKVPSYRNNLIWFKNVKNHFVVEFSDDGAPETKETTMSIGSLSMWNFGNRIRSREFHYPLHMVSANEKDEACSILWNQHSEEMQLLEDNVLYIQGEKVTVEFQPSSDQSWQFWANNVLAQNATYPSMFANVHKGDLTKIGGTIGNGLEDTWKPPTCESRKEELKKLNEFRSSLPQQLTPKQIHKEELEFMAEEGIRQIGEPRILKFADRQRPEPLHLEINNWEHVLDLIYKEAVRRDRFDAFIKVLKAPATGDEDGNFGCGLNFLSKSIKEHYESEKLRMTVLSTRLIGAQAILLARYSYRLVDSLAVPGNPLADVKQLALGKICESLRDIGSLINRVTIDGLNDYPDHVKKQCSLYFNLFSLFFNESCNSTVWTLGYVVPYHASLLFDNYCIGYGILSMQGKESKHSAIKQELRNNTNRSKSHDENSKWHQIMRSSFIRNFYLPYHFPISTYHSHYKSRIPSIEDSSCKCSRNYDLESNSCSFCSRAEVVVCDAQQGKLSNNVIEIFKPIKCDECDMRFADILLCKSHVDNIHKAKPLSNAKNIVPKKCKVTELRVYLAERNMPTSGKKDDLVRRLEGCLSKEM